jgi:hypothetical protein
MKLLLRRSERATTFGNTMYILDVRADLSAEEQASVWKYKLGKTLLYSRNNPPPKLDRDSVASVSLEIGARLLHHALNITVSVGDLMGGKRVECKDIMQMLAAVEQIKEAAQNFVSVLRAASQFGGEEVLEI